MRGGGGGKKIGSDNEKKAGTKRRREGCVCKKTSKNEEPWGGMDLACHLAKRKNASKESHPSALPPLKFLPKYLCRTFAKSLFPHHVG